jgi:uncharacterized protein (UPF0335 family)
MSSTVSSDSVAQDQLRAFIDRIERMEEEKKAIADDIKEIYGEAKGNGFDVKVLRQLVRIRKQDRDERMEQEAILSLYMDALGMTFAPPDDDDDEPPRGRAPVTKPRAPEPKPKPNSPIQQSPTAEATESNVPRNSVVEIQPGTANETPERLALAPADPLRSEAASHEDAGTTASGPQSPAPEQPQQQRQVPAPTAPFEPKVNPICLKHQRGQKCWMSHKAYSCSECNAVSAKAKAAAKAGKVA